MTACLMTFRIFTINCTFPQIYLALASLQSLIINYYILVTCSHVIKLRISFLYLYCRFNCIKNLATSWSRYKILDIENWKRTWKLMWDAKSLMTEMANKECMITFVKYVTTTSKRLSFLRSFLNYQEQKETVWNELWVKFLSRSLPSIIIV